MLFFFQDVCKPSTMFIDDCFTVDSNHWLTQVNKILVNKVLVCL